MSVLDEFISSGGHANAARDPISWSGWLSRLCNFQPQRKTQTDSDNHGAAAPRPAGNPAAADDDSQPQMPHETPCHNSHVGLPAADGEDAIQVLDPPRGLQLRGIAIPTLNGPRNPPGMLFNNSATTRTRLRSQASSPTSAETDIPPAGIPVSNFTESIQALIAHHGAGMSREVNDRGWNRAGWSDWSL